MSIDDYDVTSTISCSELIRDLTALRMMCIFVEVILNGL